MAYSNGYSGYIPIPMTWSGTSATTLAGPWTTAINGPVYSPPARKQSALEWLTAAVDEVCALARNPVLA